MENEKKNKRETYSTEDEAVGAGTVRGWGKARGAPMREKRPECHNRRIAAPGRTLQQGVAPSTSPRSCFKTYNRECRLYDTPYVRRFTIKR